MATWTYRVEAISTEYVNDDEGTARVSISGANAIEKVLAKLGDAGWELIAFLPASPAEYCANYGRKSYSTPSTYHAIFKKPEDPNDAHMRRQFNRRGDGRLPD